MLDSMMKLGTASKGLPPLQADAESNPPEAMLRQPHSLKPNFLAQILNLQSINTF